ncbi:hypothetical protein [Mycolicibacterium phage Kashi_SSH1]|nr:hypothetical protein [Mycolicibacterium phage Kashi_SSH1]
MALTHGLAAVEPVLIADSLVGDDQTARRLRAWTGVFHRVVDPAAPDMHPVHHRGHTAPHVQMKKETFLPASPQ